MTTATLQKWNDFRIRDFAKIKGGKRLPKGEFVQDEKTDHPYIRVTDMFPDRLDTAKIKYITDAQFEKIKRYTISSDDVYVSNAGTIGLIGKVPKWLSGANLTENALKITEMDGSKITQDFLMYFLRSYKGQEQIKARTGGSSQPKLALTRLADVVIHTPNIFTQKEIAHVLSIYDDLIYNNARRIKTLQQIAQTIYKGWFVDYCYPNHKKEKRVDSGTEFGEIPEGWSVVALDTIMDFQGGAQPPKSEWKDTFSDGYVRMIQIRDYESDKYTCFVKDSSKLKKCKSTDIMIARYGASVARICWGLEGAYNVALVKVFPKEPFYQEFLRQHLSAAPFQSLLIGMSGRTAQAGFNKSTFSGIKLVMPSEKLLRTFEEIISKSIMLQLSLSKINKVLIASRDKLLSKLISGQIKV